MWSIKWFIACNTHCILYNIACFVIINIIFIWFSTLKSATSDWSKWHHAEFLQIHVVCWRHLAFSGDNHVFSFEIQPYTMNYMTKLMIIFANIQVKITRKVQFTWRYSLLRDCSALTSISRKICFKLNMKIKMLLWGFSFDTYVYHVRYDHIIHDFVFSCDVYKARRINVCIKPAPLTSQE